MSDYIEMNLSAYVKTDKVIVADNSGNRKHHQIYLEILRGDGKNAFTDVSGKRSIEKLLYELAFAGGLIDADGELVITKPSERIIPEDGLYTHTHWTGQKAYIIVKKGKLYAPQVDTDGQPYEDGSVLEITEEYLASSNDLVPVKVGSD